MMEPSIWIVDTVECRYLSRLTQESSKNANTVDVLTCFDGKIKVLQILRFDVFATKFYSQMMIVEPHEVVADVDYVEKPCQSVVAAHTASSPRICC